MTRILLEGYFGESNAGDDAFCEVASTLLPLRLPAHRRPARLEVVAQPSKMAHLSGDVRPGLPDTPRVPGQVRLTTMALKLRSRAVLHVGGSTLRRMNRRRVDELHLLQSRLIQSHAVGVSVGPFRSTQDERAVGGFLRRFTSISVRDAASLERLSSMQLDVPVLGGFDLACLLPTLEVSRVPAGASAGPLLGLSLRPFESVEGEDPAGEVAREERVVDMLRQLAIDVPYRLRLISFNSSRRSGDIQCLRRVARRLDVEWEEVEYGGDVHAVYAAVAGCTAMFAMRLHAAVFAYTSGVPVLILGYHDKCRDFATTIGLDAVAVTPASGPGPEHSQVLKALLEGRGSRASKLLADAQASAVATLDHVCQHL